MRKVLIVNRGEIAVRVARACRDAGLPSVALYADADRAAPHVRAADEAYALGGDTPATSYLDVGKVLRAAKSSGADAVHPGYGFLSEDARFAQAVLDAGLTWIGPPPAAIRAVSDKVSARRVARRLGVPLVAGTPAAVSGAADVVAFAAAHGLPVAIKAAYGGGGRGLKVVHSMEEAAEAYESATREATAAYGRGECFVERYVDRSRHVEAQCLADQHGAIVVVSTRDCTLQRRHQKLVEEAPAPFLSAAQNELIYESSKAILRAAGYAGAGTCEFLVGADGTISFLEVNTRLQVEHPVSEEVTGIDLVGEMLRIADGERLGYDDPAPRGHSFEFRINCEDPGQDFLPTPGVIGRFDPPSGPGVRVDAGVESGTRISPAWDSLLAKLIVTGSTRERALRRSARALAEFRVEGVATALPFHRAVVEDRSFAPELDGSAEPFSVHTRWIETEFRNEIAPFASATGARSQAVETERHTMVVEVDGRRVEISLAAPAVSRVRRSRRGAGRRSGAALSRDDALVSPMQGMIVKTAVEEGQAVTEGDLVVVLEAMKMEQPLRAHRSGVVKELTAKPGESISAGAVICQIAAETGG